MIRNSLKDHSNDGRCMSEWIMECTIINAMTLTNRPVVKGGHRGTVPPQTLVVPPATVYLNYYETRLCGRDVLVPI